MGRGAFSTSVALVYIEAQIVPPFVYTWAEVINFLEIPEGADSKPRTLFYNERVVGLQC